MPGKKALPASFLGTAFREFHYLSPALPLSGSSERRGELQGFQGDWNHSLSIGYASVQRTRAKRLQVPHHEWHCDCNRGTVHPRKIQSDPMRGRAPVPDRLNNQRILLNSQHVNRHPAGRMSRLGTQNLKR